MSQQRFTDEWHEQFEKWLKKGNSFPDYVRKYPQVFGIENINDNNKITKWSRNLFKAHKRWRNRQKRSHVTQQQVEHEEHIPTTQPSGLPVNPSQQIDAEEDLVYQLVQFTKKPRQLGEICDKFGLPPHKILNIVEDAKRAGYAIGQIGEAIAWKKPDNDIEQAKEIEIEPCKDGWYKIAAISDLHCGSKFYRPNWLEDFISVAYEEGVRIVTNSGDTLAGLDKSGDKWFWDLVAHGFTDQAHIAHSTIPQMPGLRYAFIDGNHDETFRKSSGQFTGQRLIEYMAHRGRKDHEYLGGGSAYLAIKCQEASNSPIIVSLNHPIGGVPYALSHRPQRMIAEIESGRKPHIWLGGHLHRYVHILSRSVQGFLVPCFEAPGSFFSRRMAPGVMCGGLILQWKLTKFGTLRRFKTELMPYFEQEKMRVFDLKPISDNATTNNPDI